MSLTVGSLFTGIGGLDLGLERAGMRVAWQCDADDKCRDLLGQRWPGVPVYDDVRTVDGRVARVDVLCGGFPCQDLSVAGSRAGLAGERSGLFHEFMRIASEIAPTWVLIENVPGLLSSNDGRDMGTVLGVLADLGYGWAYRVLDAQYLGVAQRRRRVFIVGCLGDAARAASVLLEPESCAGDSPPSRTTGEGVAGTLGGGSGRRGFCDDLDRSGAFIPERVIADTVRSHPRPGSNSVGQCIAFMWQAAGNNDASGALETDFTPTLPKSQTIAVAYPLAMRGREDGAELEMGEAEVYNALRAGDGGSSRANWALTPLRAAGAGRANGAGIGRAGDPALTLDTTGDMAVAQGMAVRRLTPMECERLQGFPDGWTERFPDSTRYRMLGNAVCVPNAAWIGRRMVAAHESRAAA